MSWPESQRDRDRHRRSRIQSLHCDIHRKGSTGASTEGAGIREDLSHTGGAQDAALDGGVGGLVVALAEDLGEVRRPIALIEKPLAEPQLQPRTDRLLDRLDVIHEPGLTYREVAQR